MGLTAPGQCSSPGLLQELGAELLLVCSDVLVASRQWTRVTPELSEACRSQGG